MTDPALAQTLAFLNTYGYAVVFPISIVEGPVIAVLAGILVSLGQMNVLIVFLILLLGDIVGDVLYYAAGRYGGHSFVRRWGSRFGITDEKVTRSEELFATHDWKILLLGKLNVSPVPTGIVVLIAAGMMRVPFDRYLAYNTLGTIPRLVLFEFIGVVLGTAYLQSSGRILDMLGILSLLLTVVIVLVFLYRFREKQ